METQSNFGETSKGSERQEQIATPPERDVRERDDLELVRGQEFRRDFTQEFEA